MVLMSVCSAVEDTRSLLSDPLRDSSSGFQGRSTSHFTMQEERLAAGTLQDLHYVNTCKDGPYIQQQVMASAARRGIFHRSCSDNCSTAPDGTSGQPHKARNGLMLHKMDKPIIQKCTSESSLRTRRPGHYKNEYASLYGSHFHDDSQTSVGHIADRNNISIPQSYNVKAMPVRSSCSTTGWVDGNVSGDFGLPSSDCELMAHNGTSDTRPELIKQYQHLNGATLSCHLTKHVPIAKPDSPNLTNITFPTSGPIFDQFGVVIGNTNSCNYLAGNDKAKTPNKINMSGFSSGLQTLSANNGHIKAIRSSSYPTKLPPATFSNAASIRRQSVQSYDTSLSRHIQNSDSIIHSASPVCFVPISKVNITAAQGNSIYPVVRRTLPDDPRTCEFAPVFVKSPSYGEIESEYVTLDQRYELPDRSKMNWAIERCQVTNIQAPNGGTLLPVLNGYTTSVDDSQRFKMKNSTLFKPRPFSISAKLLTSCNGTHQVVNELLSDSLKNNPQWKNCSGTLNSNTYGSRTVIPGIDRNASISSARISNVSDRNGGSVACLNTGRYTNVGLTPKVTDCKSENRVVLKRCKSLPDLQDDGDLASGPNSNYSDDEDGDDFGFLSYPISFSSSCPSAAMNKAKSPSPGTRIFPKRWRSKSKAVPAVSTSMAMWTPGPPGSCVWSSVSGRKVKLRPVSILNLSECERIILQKIALSKLQSMDIGCPVSIPSENSDQRRNKKSLSLKRRSKSVTALSLDAMVKEGTASGLVFGIPLAKCLLNDRELDKRRSGCSATSAESSSPMKMRSGSSDNLQALRSPRKSSSSSQGSLEVSSGKHELITSHKRAASIDSLPESECSRNTSSSLIDALSLPASNPTSRLNSLAMDGNHQASQSEAHQVPYIVKACFRHIEKYGLQTLGIFRVGSSKKRVKQLREEFDSGREVQLTEEHNPHDVGALLKEYFRDMPDPLLTRELYLPFLHAERIRDDNKRHLALSLLISMLPVANRDTLWALLQFLATVSQHAPDTTDEKGETVAGNKMDAHNLATLFGPNIIHRTKTEKSSDKEMMSESAERVGQSKEIIQVIKDMIDNHHDLFEISGNLRDEILRLLVESNQEAADRILRHIANQNQIEADPESMCSVFEESANSPILYHSMNSDADLLAYAQKQTTASHRPLRITKSADDSLDSPVLKSRVALLSESQALSPASKDNHMAMPFNTIPSVHQFNTHDSHSSPLLNRVPVLRVYPESAIPDSSRSIVGSTEYPCSEGFNKSLNIPRPLYYRGSSSSSISSDLSSLNGHGWSENGFSGQWVLPTPPTSRSASPKALFQSSSSSSTLIASPAPSLINHPQVQDASFDYKPPFGSAEWERDRWKHWEKIAAQKKNIEKGQETLV